MTKVSLGGCIQVRERSVRAKVVTSTISSFHLKFSPLITGFALVLYFKASVVISLVNIVIASDVKVFLLGGTTYSFTDTKSSSVGKKLRRVVIQVSTNDKPS